jgi:hypothetical protein
VWWLWIVGGIVAWLIVGGALATVIGRSIRLADERSGLEHVASSAVGRRTASGTVYAAARPRIRRRALPLPRLAIGLLAATVGVQTVGLVLQSTGATGTAAELLALSGPASLPRLLVASLLAVAAGMALAGAARLRERRAWWSGVALVAGMIAAVKFSNPTSVVDYERLSSAVGPTGAALLGVLAVAVVAGGLWLTSRSDRRDRRRVLGALGLYAAAALGMAGASTLVGGQRQGALALTYVEEAGQAVGSVALLVAVLAGVAPRLVLPAEWALRRAADAHTLEVADPRAGRAGVRDATR